MDKTLRQFIYKLCLNDVIKSHFGSILSWADAAVINLFNPFIIGLIKLWRPADWLEIPIGVIEYNTAAIKSNKKPAIVLWFFLSVFIFVAFFYNFFLFFPPLFE